VAANDAVRNLAGVKGVTDRIKLTPLHPSPEDVKDRIERAFERSADIDAAGIEVQIHDGTVTLHGKVRSWSERNGASNAAWAAPGVTQVRNELRVVA
jgi:osmotically-inducible protein OsmY